MYGLQNLAGYIEVTDELGALSPETREKWRQALVQAAEIIRQEHEHTRSLLIQRSELMRQREAEKEARHECQERYDELQKRFDLLFTNYI